MKNKQNNKLNLEAILNKLKTTKNARFKKFISELLMAEDLKRAHFIPGNYSYISTGISSKGARSFEKKVRITFEEPDKYEIRVRKYLITLNGTDKMYISETKLTVDSREASITKKEKTGNTSYEIHEDLSLSNRGEGIIATSKSKTNPYTRQVTDFFKK